MEEYGSIISSYNHETNDDRIIRSWTIQAKNNNLYVINTSGDSKHLENHVSIIKNGLHVLSFVDKANSTDNFFTREIGKRTYKFDNTGILKSLVQDKMISKYISNKDQSQGSEIPFVTCDVETFQTGSSDGSFSTLTSYLINTYDGEKHYPHHISDSKDNYEMIDKFIFDLVALGNMYHDQRMLEYEIEYNKKILEAKKNNLSTDNIRLKKSTPKLLAYFHNFGNFDSYFIIDRLIHHDTDNSIKIIKNKDTMISISVTIRGVKLKFYDSLLLLPYSLDTLSKYFNDKESQKTYFNHELVNQYNIMDYKYESIKYCKQDCLALYNIIKEFKFMIESMWNVDITKHPTLSSLAFKIFTLKYLADNIKIPQIGGDIFNHLKTGYTGGATEMYIPYHESHQFGENLYYYDVNSLYPHIMATCKLPVGPIYYFEGDITLDNPDTIGFFHCKVDAPLDLEHPILQIHVDNKTLSPVGQFEGMFYSKEIENARKYGYKFEIMWGYKFNSSKIIFKEYVENMYSLRKSYPKDHPMNFIAKLLMNSLYGRFGMTTQFSKNILTDDYSKLDSDLTISIEDVWPMKDNKFWVKYEDLSPNNSIDASYRFNNSSIAVAAAITAEARIYMSQFKNNPNIKLYYTDTDSIVIDKSPSELDLLFPMQKGIVDNNKLGKLKLEYVIKKAIFIAPKSYFLVLEDNTTVVKIKGVKKNFLNNSIEDGTISFNSLKNILNIDSSLNITQNKWKRSYEEGNITILNTTYEIKCNDNKRIPIYENDFMVGTKPVKLSISSPIL